MTGDLDADLSCDVCGQSAVVTGLDPVRLEHALTVFTDLHAHTAAERGAWYRSEEVRAAAYRGDPTNPDGDDQDGGYR